MCSFLVPDVSLPSSTLISLLALTLEAVTAPCGAFSAHCLLLFFLIIDFLKNIYLFIRFWLRWFLVSVRGSFHCSVQGLLFFEVHGLLIGVASLVAEHGL